ncbi:MAG: hypothetical protein LBU81_01150 [Methanosarcinales archaeon]|jgi:hypothetical protein|nr:hypothetical protein [Methanosarcinales archaeon]
MKKSYFILIAIICIAIDYAPGTAMAAGGTLLGTGTETDPYLIEDNADLMAFKTHYSGLENLDYNRFYEIDSDLSKIDLTGETWEPVADFNGTFNGNDVPIKNLGINGGGDIGFFSSVSMMNSPVKQPAVIKNVVIENARVSGTGDKVGILAASNNNGTISNIKIINSTVSGAKNNTATLVAFSGNGTIENIKIEKTTLTGPYEAGLLIGTSYNDSVNYISIQDSTVQEAAGDPSFKPLQNIGGAVGEMNSTLKNLSLNNVTINAPNCSYVGGIAGQQFGSASLVKDSYARNITITATGNVGGITGLFNRGTIENCSVEGDASKGETITSNYRNDLSVRAAGGLVGQANGIIEECYTDIDVFGGNRFVGGFIGTGSPNLEIGDGCYALGNVTAPDVSYVGGFIGRLRMSENGSVFTEGELKSCYAEGDVSGGTYVGGFIGMADYTSKYTIIDCYATGNVTASDELAGGFIGMVNTAYMQKVENCCATGNVTAKQKAGGFAGQISNATNCYAVGNVSVKFENAGGFAGYAENVSQSYALGDVKSEGYVSEKYEFWGARGGAEPSYVGGFAGTVGSAYGSVKECFAAGDVTGDLVNAHAGGFAGINSGTIENCYSTGDVTGAYTGGFSGTNRDGNIENSYAAGNVSGKICAGGLIGAVTGSKEAEYTISGNMALGENVNSMDEDSNTDKIYGSVFGVEKAIMYEIGDNGNIYYEYQSAAPVENWEFQNNYVWNGIQNKNGSISNKLNENDGTSDDVISVKSYNVWDTFGKSNDALRNSAWDTSWSTSVWKLNSYSPNNEFMLPILKWQTLEKQNPEANAVYLLYLTQIDIETDNGKAETATDFKITVDEKEVEYSKVFFSDWEWNLKAAYSDLKSGSSDNLFDVYRNMDNSTKTYTTDVKDLSSIAAEEELYAWGKADLAERIGPDTTLSVTSRFGETYTFSLNPEENGGGRNEGLGSRTGSVSVTETQEIRELPTPGIETIAEPVTEGDIDISQPLLLSFVIISIAVFADRKRHEKED